MEEADEEHRMMMAEEAHVQHRLPFLLLVAIPMTMRRIMEVIEEPAKPMRGIKEFIEEPAERVEENMKVAIEIPSPFMELKGFKQRNIDEIQSYYEKQRKSRNVDRGHGGTGFYKVPDDMRQRQQEEHLYDPTYINFSKVRDMLEKDDLDDERRSLLSHFYYHFSHVYEINRGKKLEDYLWIIYEKHKEEIARCYRVEEEDLDFPHFLGLLLCSCFVIYLFYLPVHGVTLSIENECECFHQWVNDLWVDLLVLENQIPFCVLESVFFKFKGRRSLEVYVCIYFREFVPLHWIGKNHESVHLLDFVHRSLLPDKRSDHHSFFTNLPIFRYLFTKLSCFGNSIREFLWENPIARLLELCPPIRVFLRENPIARLLELPVRRVIPTATRLQQAGVQFRVVERKGFVVEFKRGVLRLPRLHIEKNTKKFFLNLIAWEQCHQPAVKYVINFTVLMDHLINTSKDVEILIQNSVLEHTLKTEEDVAIMFNSLGKDLIGTKNEKNNQEYDFLMELSTKLNKFCEDRFSNWRAKLMIEYFSSPWTILSLIAALLLLLLSVVQAFFSAYSYFRPPK